MQRLKANLTKDFKRCQKIAIVLFTISIVVLPVLAESKNDALINRSLEFMNAKKYQKAVDLLTRVISTNPNDATAYDDRASAYIFLGKYERAIEDENTSLAKDDRNYIGHLNRGVAFFSMGQNEKALGDFKNAHELKPQAAAALRNMGIAMAKLGNKDEATKLLSEVREIYVKTGDINEIKELEETAAQYGLKIR
jgi:tetratricopeptide (TPR) repeat protein